MPDQKLTLREQLERMRRLQEEAAKVGEETRTEKREREKKEEEGEGPSPS